MSSESLIIGSGLLARAFSRSLSNNESICVYAAGVSDSSCKDIQEFLRERECLSHALVQNSHIETFIYFGTCSVDDPEARNTAYVQHKLKMEQLVLTHPNYLILRLPQVAGKTTNPHTLLNFLYARITRSEAFCLWTKAKRNIIDVDDVSSIAHLLIADNTMRNITLNIANPVGYSMMEIVSVMEKVVGKPAIYDPIERGSEYPIEINAILPVMSKSAVKFGDGYLDHVLDKYYGKAN